LAAGKIENGRRPSFLTKLLTPRWVSIVGLIAVGAALGDLAWRLLPFAMYVYAATLATPMCMAVAVAAWAMRDKVDTTFDPDYLASGEYARSRHVVRDLRVRSMVLAIAATGCACLAGSPVLAAQQLHAVWEWMAIASGIGVGLAGVCFQVAFYWEEQLRAHRETLIASVKDRDERAELALRVERSKLGSEAWGPGWGEPDGEELTRPH
jgi:hypothetical protein